jgi:hypothetical protein
MYTHVTKKKIGRSIEMKDGTKYQMRKLGASQKEGRKL